MPLPWSVSVSHPGSETAAKMAVEDFGGEVLGRKVEIVVADHLNKADVSFAQDMIPHHGMAVMMSQQLLAGGLAEHPEVTDLANTIRDDQRAEIMMMRDWLRTWFGTTAHGHGHR